jgi:leucyl-tRNA synthetase
MTTSSPEVDWRQVTLPASDHAPLSADAPGLVEAFKFNVVVARLMELVNAARKAIDQGPGGADPAVREAVETIALGLSLFAPYTAEDMWERLGYPPSISGYAWRTADPALLTEESVTAVVQVDGKVRDRLDVSPTINPVDLEKLARESPAVLRFLGDRDVVNVIVRAPKLVNIATKLRS